MEGRRSQRTAKNTLTPPRTEKSSHWPIWPIGCRAIIKLNLSFYIVLIILVQKAKTDNKIPSQTAFRFAVDISLLFVTKFRYIS